MMPFWLWACFTRANTSNFTIIYREMKGCLLVLLLVGLGSGKVVTPLVTLTPQSRWVYVSKFVLLDGRGIWDLKARLHNSFNETSDDRSFLHINVYPESVWEEALANTDCAAKTHISREKRIKVPLNGNFSTAMKGTLNQNQRVHVWYFAVSDCENHLPESVKLRLELSVHTRYNTEFSYEDEGLVYLYSIGTVVFFIGMFASVLGIYRRFKRTDYTDWRQVCLGVAVGFQFCGLLLQSLHLVIYAYNGRGVIIFDFFSQALEMFSHLLIAFVLILISTGWTLKFREFPSPDTYAPVILLLVILHLALACASKVTDDAYYKFSDYENTSGWILVTLRILLWVWFLANVRNLLKISQGKIRDFLLSFTLFSSVYFLSIPVTVFLSLLFPPYQRNAVLAVGNLFIQTIAFWLLHDLFSDKSTYFKISTASEGVLPGKIRSD